MERAKIIKEVVCKYIELLEEDIIKQEELVHSHLVASFCSLLAIKRGLDQELALVIGYLHDIGRIISKGINEKHALVGALEAERILSRTRMFSIEEIEVICDAIRWHSKKGKLGGLYCELIKDADTFAPFMLSPEEAFSENRKVRMNDIIEEFSLHSQY